MILEKESEIRVMRTFCDEPFDYFSVAEISQKANISRNWIYKVIDKFEKSGILMTCGKKYKLNFSNVFCKRLKLLFDSDYLNSLNEDVKRDVFNMANKMLFEINPQSIVLVGSAAAQKMKKGSDIDFIVIGGNREKVPMFVNSNIILLSCSEFKERYAKGDDFVISALVFGKIIHDDTTFIKFFESPLPIFSEELIQEKIKYCEKLEERVYALLKTDVDEARNELLYLALQAARIILLRNRIIPKTKHDIAPQVYEFDRELAKIIRKLLREEKIKTEDVLDYTKRCVQTARSV